MDLQPFNLNTSLEALISTIETDDEIANWFYYLLSESSLKSEFGEDAQFCIGFKRLRGRVFFQNTAKIIVLLFLFTVLFSGAVVYFLAFIPMLILLFVNDKSIRKDIGGLSQKILSRDFKYNDFQNKSLYQICENYSEKYGLASLVKVQFFTVNFVRIVLVYSILVFGFAMPLKLLQSYIAIAIFFYASKIITGFYFMFGRMK